MVGMDRLANAAEVDKLHGRSDMGANSTQRFSCCETVQNMGCFLIHT